MRRGPLNGLSDSWKSHDIEAALALQRAVVEARPILSLAAQVGELAASNAQLESFAYTAAHDLRAPLRGIHISSDWLAEELGDTIAGVDKARLQTIRRLSFRMDELLQSLMDFSKARLLKPEREPTDLNLLLEEVRESIAHELEAARAIVTLSRPLPTFACDRFQIYGVLSNLILNGVKYNTNAEKVIEIGYRDGPETVFFVKDNGIGIPADQHENVFTLFRRLHKKDEFGGGTGAGLAIVRKSIENHGGRIWIESEPGSGSTFCFALNTSMAG